MFERFTEPARQVVVLAQDEARTLRHDAIGTEHMLLALLRVDGGMSVRVLTSLGLTSEKVRARVARTVGHGNAFPPALIPFTPDAKRALELAWRESLTMGHDWIGTEHLLLGLVGEERGAAASVLVDCGVAPDSVNREIVRLLSGYDSAPAG